MLNEEIATSIVQLLQNFFAIKHTEALLWKQAANACWVHVCRAGWPAFELSHTHREELKLEIYELAKSLHYAKDPKAIETFSRRVSSAVCKKTALHAKAKPLSRMTAIIHAELKSGCEPGEIATRAAKRVYDEEQRHKKRTVDVGLGKTDLLRQVLAIPQSSGTRLPKQDVRAQLLRDQPLVSLLRKAAPFSSNLMKSILPEELFKCCTPVGFADRFHKIVLVEVDSSSVAHEMSYQKHRIINHLRQVPELSHITDVRFKVTQPSK